MQLVDGVALRVRRKYRGPDQISSEHYLNTAVPMSTKLLGRGAERQGTFSASL